MKRFGTVDDVTTHLVGFLASEESGYITGQVICIDGGCTMSQVIDTSQRRPDGTHRVVITRYGRSHARRRRR